MSRNNIKKYYVLYDIPLNPPPFFTENKIVWLCPAACGGGAHVKQFLINATTALNIYNK